MGARKPWAWVLLAPAVLLLAVGGQTGNAQDNPKGKDAKPPPKATPGKQQVKGGVHLGKYGELIEELDLTEEQQVKLAGLVLYQGVIGRYQSAVPSSHAKGKSKAVAPEQPPDPLQLTDSQKAMIKALCLDAVRQPQTAVVKAKGGGGVLDKAMRSMREQVLSDEQDSALAAAQLEKRVMGQALAGLSAKGPEAIRLSGQQLAQIKAICRDAARDLGPSGDEKVNAEAIRGVAERVQDVLTPEQREEVNRRLEARRARKGKSGGVKQPPGGKGAKPLGGDGGKGK